MEKEAEESDGDVTMNRVRVIYCLKCHEEVECAKGMTCPQCHTCKTIDVSRYSDPGESDIPYKIRRHRERRDAV